MAMYWKEITVNWGESDPFGLVYYPRIVAWFSDTEHELFRVIGYPIEQMIKNDRTTFVMGEIHFRFIGPAAYGDRIVNTITPGRRSAPAPCTGTARPRTPSPARRSARARPPASMPA